LVTNDKQALWHLGHYKGPWDGLAIDIGAYHGDFALAVADRGCEVIAYEANVHNFHMLLTKIANMPTVYALHAAIVGEPSGAWVTSGSGATCKVRLGNSSNFVGTIGFADLLRQHEQIDLLKIDIEGGEHEIFARKHRDELKPLLKRIRWLQLEIHPRDNFTSQDAAYIQQVNELIYWLQQCGFKDKPCKVRKKHPGDFCSHNKNFKEAARSK
jgi:FkbM family methyltransferase